MQNLKRDLDNFVDKLRYHASETTTEVSAPNNKHLDSGMISQFGNLPPSKSRSLVDYRKDKTNINSLETLQKMIFLNQIITSELKAISPKKNWKH